MTDRGARLDAVRREIDALDTELLGLLNRRGRAAIEAAAVKSREADSRLYRPEREAVLLRRLRAVNQGPLPDAEVRRLFREIVSTCRALEQRLAIGCTTVAEACAALGHFGGAVDIHALADTAAALAAVVAARCDYAMIAFLRGDAAPAAVAELPERGLAFCGEWYAGGGERFVVIGREPVPPSGDDWTSFTVPTQHVGSIGSWCRRAGLPMRSAPIADRVSLSVVEVATRTSEPRLAQCVARYGGRSLGVYPVSPGARDTGAPE